MYEAKNTKINELHCVRYGHENPTLFALPLTFVHQLSKWFIFKYESFGIYVHSNNEKKLAFGFVCLEITVENIPEANSNLY